MLCVAVDWSGAKTGAAKKIWTAEASEGRLLRLTSGRGREETAEYLAAFGGERDEVVVGLDFAFSFPAWFARENGAGSGPEMWEVCRLLGEGWLQECGHPFWGPPGTKKPAGVELYRQGEEPAGAKSVFHIHGPGAVGTASVRGMPVLLRLGAAGFHVWPFDEPALPLVVEIYPRTLTGPVTKSSAAARWDYLARLLPSLPDDLRAIAAGSEDAFDAAVSAVVMWHHREEFAGLQLPPGDLAGVEGTIWLPAGPHASPGCPCGLKEA